MPATDTRPALVWFRDDLRLADNPALSAAVASGRPLVLLYILDEQSTGLRPLGGAARWWLARSLSALERQCSEMDGVIIFRRGCASAIIFDLVAKMGIGAVYWNRRYGAGEIALDRSIKENLTQGGITTESFNATLLDEPWTVLTNSRQPYRVFTPYRRAATAHPPRLPLPSPKKWQTATAPAGEALLDWGLEPARPDWAAGLRAAWMPGEAGARERLADFLDGGIKGYAERRDRPDIDHTSRLSPFLRFGNISPHQTLAALRHAQESGRVSGRDAEKFVSEIYWREFSYHLLFHFPNLPERNFQPRFDAFPWRDDPALLAAWQRGRTGYPIVDAGMRQLWETGWMHNRVRMVVASFLIKHGLTDWRKGEAWFWDTLVDADAASNSASWQWVAGSGADAAPYFRIFNPILQGEKFDPRGDYVRRFVPELGKMPAETIHKPWLAGEDVLRKAGVTLGESYPRPIVDHAAGRARALAAFETTRTG